MWTWDREADKYIHESGEWEVTSSSDGNTFWLWGPRGMFVTLSYSSLYQATDQAEMIIEELDKLEASC